MSVKRMSHRVENSYQAEYLRSLEQRLGRSQIEHSYSQAKTPSTCPANTESASQRNGAKGYPTHSPKTNQSFISPTSNKTNQSFISPTSNKNIDYMIQKYAGKPNVDKSRHKSDKSHEIGENVNSPGAVDKVGPTTTKHLENASCLTVVTGDVGCVENKVPKLTIKVSRKRKRSSADTESPSTKPGSKRRRTASAAKHVDRAPAKHVDRAPVNVDRAPVNGLVKSASRLDDLRLKIEAKRAARLLGKDYSSRRERILNGNYSPKSPDGLATNVKLDRTLKRLSIDGVCPDTTLQRLRGADTSPKTKANSPKSVICSPSVRRVQKSGLVTSVSRRRSQKQKVLSPTVNVQKGASPIARVQKGESPIARVHKGESPIAPVQKETGESPLNSQRRPLRNSPHTNMTPVATPATSLKRKRAAKSLSPIFFKDTGKAPVRKKRTLSSRRTNRTKSQSEISPVESLVENKSERRRPRKLSKPRHTRSLGSVLRPGKVAPRTPSHSAVPRPHGANSPLPSLRGANSPVHSLRGANSSPSAKLVPQPCPLDDVAAASEKGSPRSVLGQLQSSSPKPFAYRMNGSPKLNGLPAVLSLNSLSGIQHSLQELATLRQGFPPTTAGSASTIPHSPPMFPGSPGTKSSPRPRSLLLDNNSSITSTTISPFTELKSQTHTPDASPKLPQSSTDKHLHSYSQAQSRRKMTLSETVEMLKNKTTSLKNFEIDSKTRKSVSPVSSEKSGRLSRRSSRSSTPNISPMKSEMLTPVSTPQPTPTPSPTTTQTLTTSPGKGAGPGERRHHLFEVDSEVLARWHDGLYYRVKILKIDEKQRKCELQYEDNSVFWSFFKDIHRGACDGETICCVCLGETSDAPNEIVLCDNCGQGYHQKCHQPTVDAREVLNPDDDWHCRPCVFALSIKSGGALKEGKYADQLLRIKRVLPYDLQSLTWDMQHKMNVEQVYCYCGGPGIWYQKMLQCCRCKQWFHEACVQCLEQPLVMADSFYIFVCATCNEGDEYIKRLAMAWSDLVHIALFNLSMHHNRKFFDFHDYVLPWVDENWPRLQAYEYNDMDPMDRYDKIEEALINNKTRFCCGPDMKKQAVWGLRVRVPPPRTKVDLPFSGKVTSSVMKTHKITGRRSKVIVPKEWKPSVKPHQSPDHQSALIHQKPTDKLALNQEQAAADPIASPAQVRPAISSPAMLKQPTVKTFLLDRLVPTQENYESYNSPFLTEMEQIERRFDFQQKVRFWNFFSDFPENPPVIPPAPVVPPTTTSRVVDGHVTSSSDSPPVLEKVEPVTPSSGVSPPMPEIDDGKKRQSMKSENIKVELELEDQTPKNTSSDESGRVNRRSSRKKIVQSQSSNSLNNSLGNNSPSNHGNAGSQRSSSMPDCSLPLKKWKSVTKNYFGAFDRLCYGKGMHLVAKRSNQSGSDYLLVWDSLGFDKDEV